MNISKEASILVIVSCLLGTVFGANIFIKVETVTEVHHAVGEYLTLSANTTYTAGDWTIKYYPNAIYPLEITRMLPFSHYDFLRPLQNKGVVMGGRGIYNITYADSDGLVLKRVD